MVPPSFVETPSPCESTVGEDISWSCKAYGKPIPVITWYRDQQPLDGQDKIKVKNSETSRKLQSESSLKIEACELNSEGMNYRVEAENAAGKVSHTFSLAGTNQQKCQQTM